MALQRAHQPSLPRLPGLPFGLLCPPPAEQGEGGPHPSACPWGHASRQRTHAGCPWRGQVQATWLPPSWLPAMPCGGGLCWPTPPHQHALLSTGWWTRCQWGTGRSRGGRAGLLHTHRVQSMYRSDGWSSLCGRAGRGPHRSPLQTQPAARPRPLGQHACLTQPRHLARSGMTQGTAFHWALPCGQRMTLALPRLQRVLVQLHLAAGCLERRCAQHACAAPRCQVLCQAANHLLPSAG